MAKRDENGSTRSCLLPSFKPEYCDKNSLALISMDERHSVVETANEKSLFLRGVELSKISVRLISPFVVVLKCVCIFSSLCYVNYRTILKMLYK